MKKILAILLCGILLCGCGKSSVDTEENTTENTTEDTTTTADELESSDETENSDESENNGEAERTKKYYLTFTAKSVDGTEVTSDILDDAKLTMINVWATYCNPCLQEMPGLGEIAAEYDADTFQMIGVVCDVSETSSQEDVDYVKELIDKTEANYLHLLTSEDLYNNLVCMVSVVPTTFFVKQDGSVRGYVTGAMNKESWEDVINDLLAEMEE